MEWKCPNNQCTNRESLIPEIEDSDEPDWRIWECQICKTRVWISKTKEELTRELENVIREPTEG